MAEIALELQLRPACIEASKHLDIIIHGEAV